MFIDETALYLLAAAVYTWAPKGQTPILKLRPWEHLSVISAMTPEGKLYTMMQDWAFRGPDIIRFLQHLLRHISGALLVIWDGLPAHRSQPIKALLQEGAAKRLHLEQLPGYAPDLNPDEGDWNDLKNVKMRNLCCHDLVELRDECRKAIARMRHKVDAIKSFVKQAGLASVVLFSIFCLVTTFANKLADFRMTTRRIVPRFDSIIAIQVNNGVG